MPPRGPARGKIAVKDIMEARRCLREAAEAVNGSDRSYIISTVDENMMSLCQAQLGLVCAL